MTAAQAPTTTGLDPITKRCKTCGEVKPASEFYRARTNRDGLMTECRACNAERRREVEQRARAAMGEEAYLEHKRSITARSRSNPEVRRRGVAITNARGAALERLALMYPKAFDHLLREERSARGLPPVPNRVAG